MKKRDYRYRCRKCHNQMFIKDMMIIGQYKSSLYICPKCKWQFNEIKLADKHELAD